MEEAIGDPAIQSKPAPSGRCTDPRSWLDEHGDFLYAFALAQVRDKDTAEDLVQETLLGAIRSRDGFSGTSEVRTWLVGILKHKIADHFRRRSLERRAMSRSEPEATETFVEELFSAGGKWLDCPRRWRCDPGNAATRDELRATLRQCLGRLSPTLAEAIRLREIGGLDGRTLCEVLGLSENALWTQLHRARVALRECVERLWSTGRERRR